MPMMPARCTAIRHDDTKSNDRQRNCLTRWCCNTCLYWLRMRKILRFGLVLLLLLAPISNSYWLIHHHLYYHDHDHDHHHSTTMTTTMTMTPHLLHPTNTAVTQVKFRNGFLIKRNPSTRAIQNTTTVNSTSSSRTTSSNMLMYIPKQPTILVQLRGEMGNHLSAIAHGRGLQLWALERFGLETNLVLRHQVVPTTTKDEESPIKLTDSPKWISTSRTLKLCFSSLSDWDFDRGSNWKEFTHRQEQQEQWLEYTTRKQLNYVNGRPPKGTIYRDPQPIREDDLDLGLDVFQQKILLSKNQDRRSSTGVLAQSSAEAEQLLSLPYLYSTSLDNLVLLDHYVEHFRDDLFRLNPSCCAGTSIGNNNANHDALAPDADETVFHFRNFATELTKISHGLEDTSPNQTATILLGHLQPGDKVAITYARNPDDHIKILVDALQARGLQVRVISGKTRTGIQDFCFLMQAQKELIGNFQSTFLLWAALLGNAKRARLYTLDSPRLRERYGPTVEDRFLYKFSHPQLQHRVSLELIPFAADKDVYSIVN